VKEAMPPPESSAGVLFKRLLRRTLTQSPRRNRKDRNVGQKIPKYLFVFG
jgi:hypothetical protein